MMREESLEQEGFRLHFPKEFNEGIRKIRMDYCDYPMKTQECGLNDCVGKVNCEKYLKYKEKKK